MLALKFCIISKFRLFILLIFSVLPLLVTSIRYKPEWDSLDKRPLPEWYDNAKVGIFIHWGVYSVPAFGSEWFWTDWKNIKDPKYIEFMNKNYKPNFQYQSFASDFTAELFNATEWALILQESGAKYVVLTSKHHDGYTLWPSPYSFGWNSMDVGPKRDIMMELSSAVRQHSSLKFGAYYSLFEWFNRLYINDKLNLFLKQNYVNNKLQPELKSMIELYLPEVLWSDGDWEAPDHYWNSTDIIAWLYNDSPVRDTIVTNDRWGFGTQCAHGDFYNCKDRYNPHSIIFHKWENAFSIDKSSWGQRFDIQINDILTAKEIIDEIVTTVSCNGNVLINIGPTKYGTILPIFQERLFEMGKWLKINGEAIYNTKPWIIQNDTKTPGVWYTQKKNFHSEVVIVYAIVLEYPYETNEIDLHPLGKLYLLSDMLQFSFVLRNNIKGLNNNTSVSIEMLGLENVNIKWSERNNSIHIVFPPKNLLDKIGLKYAWTFRITLK